MPVAAIQDHCQTAADVMRASLAVIAKRKQSYGPPEPEQRRSPMLQAPPSTLVFWDGSTWITRFPFQFLVRSSYPQRYPDAPLFLDQPITDRPNVTAVISRVAEVAGLRVGDLMSARRTANVVLPRQIGMALAKRLTLRSLPEIGRRFGGRDHTTVLHAIRKMEPVIDAVEDHLPQGSTLDEWVKAALYLAGTMKLEYTRGKRARLFLEAAE